MWFTLSLAALATDLQIVGVPKTCFLIMTLTLFHSKHPKNYTSYYLQPPWLYLFYWKRKAYHYYHYIAIYGCACQHSNRSKCFISNETHIVVRFSGINTDARLVFENRFPQNIKKLYNAKPCYSHERQGSITSYM